MLVLQLLLISLAQQWMPLSRTAMSITGNVEVTGSAIRMAGQRFPMMLVVDIDREHLPDVGTIFGLMRPPDSAGLYKTSIPRSTKLLRGNDVCGSKDAKWILTATGGGQLSIAFFSGNSQPSLDPKAVSQSHDLCATFAYTK